MCVCVCVCMCVWCVCVCTFACIHRYILLHIHTKENNTKSAWPVTN